MSSLNVGRALSCVAVFLCSGVVFAGNTAEFSFSYFKNEPVAGLQVPLSLVEGENGFSYEGFADRTGGTDLRVFDTDGTTLLQYEIENWNPEGVSIVWVKVPQFSSSTKLTLSWGDASAEAAPEGNIWTDMNLVWHLAHGAKDSSPFAATGGMTENPIPADAIGVGARAGNSAAYAVENPSIPANQLGVISNQFTISFWARIPEISGGKYFAMHCEDSEQRISPVYNYSDPGAITLYTHSKYTGRNLYNKNYALKPVVGAWTHVAFAYDGTTIRGYLNGHEKLNKAVTFSVNTWEGAGRAVRVCGSSSAGFEGLCMDEYRVEGVARSAEWIRAACETQYPLLKERGIELSFPEAPADETLTNFTALVVVDPTVKGYGDYQHGLLGGLVNGTAVVRDAATGNDLPYEIDSVITNGSENSVAIWVKIPEYSRNTKINVYPVSGPMYVPEGSEDVADTESVLTENDVMVVHMRDATRLQLESVTGEYLSPYKGSSSAMPTPTAGPTGPYGAVTSGTNTLLVNTSYVFPAKAVTNLFTLSFWIRKDDWDTPQRNMYFLHFEPSGGGQRAVIGGFVDNRNNNELYFFNCSASGRKIPIPDAGWHNYTFVQKPGKQWIYVDGVLKSSVNGDNYGVNLNLAAQSSRVAIGGTTGRNHSLKGAMDELRIEDVARSATWVKARYDNQKAAVDGVWRTPSPHFARKVSVSGGESSLTFDGTLVCKVASEVRLYYGSSDKGETDEGWDGYIDLGGSVAEGVLSAEVNGLAADTAKYARFAARNAYSDGWVFSGCAFGRTRPLETGRKPRRATVTFDYDGSSLEGFPVAIRIPATSGLSATPSRFRVRDTAGNSLPYEVETWNPSGESVVWVRLPVLDESTAVVLEWDMGTAAGEVWPSEETWADDFLKVNHFSSAYVDSASGAVPSSNGIGQVTSGVIGEALAFDGRAGMLRYEDSPVFGFDKGFSLSFWAKTEDSCGACYLLGNQKEKVQISVLYSWESATEGKFRLYSGSLNNTDVFKGNAHIERTDDAWHHYAWTYDGRELVCLKDGVVLSRLAYPFTLGVGWSESMLNSFFACTSSGVNQFVGSLDEYRFERRGRSAEWIKACYDNQKSGSVFAKVGPTAYRGLAIVVR